MMMAQAAVRGRILPPTGDPAMSTSWRQLAHFTLSAGEHLGSLPDPAPDPLPATSSLFGASNKIPYLPGDGFCEIAFVISSTGAQTDVRHISTTSAGGDGSPTASTLVIPVDDGPRDVFPDGHSGRSFYRNGAIVVASGGTATVTPFIRGDWGKEL